MPLGLVTTHRHAPPTRRSISQTVTAVDLTQYHFLTCSGFVHTSNKIRRRVEYARENEFAIRWQRESASTLYTV